MFRPFARTSLAAALGLALASIASAQTAPPPGPGQTGILIGRPQAPAATVDAHKNVSGDAHKAALKSTLKDAHKGSATHPAPTKPAAGAQGIMMPPGNARAAGGQDPSNGPSGGQKRPGSAGLAPSPAAGGMLANPSPATAGPGSSAGQGPLPLRPTVRAESGGQGGQTGAGPQGGGGQGPIKRPAGAAQLAGQEGGGQAGSGMQNPLGVQVREGQGQSGQEAGGGIRGPQGRSMGPAGQPLTRGLEHKGATGLSGQPNPAAAAAEATKAVR